VPGTYTSIYLLAFDTDPRGQPLKAFEPRLAASESVALDEARGLTERHTGVVVWKRDGNPTIGEEGDAVILFQAGHIGDFD
jgi:hypothetical protein